MKLILHIGSSKTGSSALQKFLSDNSGRLQQHGYLYPDIGKASNAHHVLAACFHQDAHHMHRKEITRPFAEMIEGFRDQILTAQRDHPHHTLMISSEYMWNLADPAPIIEFFNGLGYSDITVFCYLRELSEWVQSQFFQAVKGGEQRRFRPWLRHFIGISSIDFDYFENLKKWDDLPDVNRVTARIYSKQTVPAGVASDFLEYLGVPDKDFDTKAQRINPSPTVAYITILGVLNAMPLSDAEKTALRRTIMDMAPMRELHQDIHFLMPFELQMLKNTFGDKIAKVSDRFVVADHAMHPLLIETAPGPDRTQGYGDAIASLLQMVLALKGQQADS